MKQLLLLLFSLVYVLVYIVADELPEGVTITETNLYVATVDNLRIRETPDINGKVIGKIMRFEEVEYQGATSQVEMALDVDGEQISAPWIKVKMKTGVEGWIWGGFLSKINQYIDKTIGYKFSYPNSLNYLTENSLSFHIRKKKIFDLPNTNEICNDIGEDYLLQNVLKEIDLLKQGKACIYPRKVTLKKVYKINHNQYANGYFDWWTYVADIFSFDLKLVFYNRDFIVLISVYLPTNEMLKAIPELFTIYMIEKSEFEAEILARLNDKNIKDEMIQYYAYKEENHSNTEAIHKYYVLANNEKKIKKRVWEIFKSIEYQPKNVTLESTENLSEIYYNLDNYDLKGAAKDWYDCYNYIIQTLEIFE